MTMTMNLTVSYLMKLPNVNKKNNNSKQVYCVMAKLLFLLVRIE